MKNGDLGRDSSPKNAPSASASKPKPLQSLKMAASNATAKALPVAHAAAQYMPGILETLQLSKRAPKGRRT